MWSDDKGCPPPVAIGAEGESIRRQSSNHISRHRHQLSIGRCVSHVLDDLRHGELQPIVGRDIGPKGKDEEVDFPIRQDAEQDAAVETLLAILIRAVDTAGGLAELEVADLFWLEPTMGEFWGVDEKDEASQADENRNEPLKDENLAGVSVGAMVDGRAQNTLTHLQLAYPATPSIMDMA